MTWYSAILAPEDVTPQAQGTPAAPVAKRNHNRSPDSTRTGTAKRKPGPPRVLLTVEEQVEATTLSAAGWAPSRVAKHIGRSRNIVAHHLEKPETIAEVIDERSQLVELYKDRARACVVAIDADKISKASALQLATSSGILLDKSLLLSGQPTSINVVALLDVLDVMRERNNADQQAEVSSDTGQ